MRLIVRIATIAAALVVILVASGIVLIYFNQRRVILGVLASIKQQTGIAIVPASGHLEVRDHLIVELDHPRVMSGDHELVALDKIRAVVNFRSMFTHGLPLRELGLDGPALTVPFDANSVPAPVSYHVRIPRRSTRSSGSSAIWHKSLDAPRRFTHIEAA